MMEKVNTLVVDKTGTLTEGKPRLVEVITSDGFEEKDLLRAAASVEQNSEHPLAAAVMQGAKERGVKPQAITGFDSVTGGGVAGKLDGKEIIAGAAMSFSSVSVIVNALRLRRQKLLVSYSNCGDK